MRIATTSSSNLSIYLRPRPSEATRTLAALCIGVALGLAGCGHPQLSPATPGVFDGERALADVATQVGRGPRIPGSAAHFQTGEWILGELRAAGWETSVQEFAFRGVRLRNLIGRAGPARPGGILLGAHYDTRPQADREATSTGSPVPGANDGASGVAVLLELARLLPIADLNQPVAVVFFDGEDSGRIDGWPWILGSTEYVARSQQLPATAVIVDMVGDADLQLYLEQNSNPELAAELWGIGEELGNQAFIPVPGHRLVDDHTPFVQAGIPAVVIIDLDYPYWHTTQDSLDKVSADSLAQVGGTLLTWLERLALDS